MSEGFWQSARALFSARAGHVTVEFVAEPGGAAVVPYAGYVRLWLAEGFLAQAASWGNKHFPAVRGGARLSFGGAQAAAFAVFNQAPDAIRAPGAQLHFPLTPLLPYEGGLIEVQAALYRASTDGPLAVAARLAGALAPLIGPPLTSAVAITERLTGGLDEIFRQSDETPILALHNTLASDVRPGHLIVADAEPGSLGGQLCVRDGLAHVETAGGPVRLTGVNYLVVRIECRTEHDSWRFPHLDTLIRDAHAAYFRGQDKTFDDLRTEAIAAAWNSPDLTPADRPRVALLVRDQVDLVRTPGLAADPGLTLEAAAADRLPARSAPELSGLRLADLLA